ncbi:citramalate synthase [Chamaesiphon minutus]|uniref:Citramalate synthase n=1 Tax=Chamaesiphon minutus (strain ATCC 27169 / PCC 6605) TaxID=1173020 RepID=K9UPM4_CHAP6|nr:citramalate synthase [Chamaesiphon minutus]AFY96643.1 2-isopropylmalate synthase/homocitrate synthase family protein [Chamaesiphon minutus PCC 6605]
MTIQIYDTTLRDGAQREGMTLAVEDKLKIARQLDRLGIPWIEGGWPGANPKDGEFFRRLQLEPLTQAEVVAFCSTRRPGGLAAEDRMLAAIIAAGTKWVTIFGKSWDLHVTEGLKTDLAENLEMIRDSIEYLISQGKRIIYDAEHWFDGYLANPEYAIQTLQTAIAAGADWLVFCDTNGGTLPQDITEIVDRVIKTVDPQRELQFGIHTHNDCELAVANALAAVSSGVTMVQGTINGYGERCGNANLCAIIPNLQLKLGYSCLSSADLMRLTQVSRYVSEVVNIAPNDYAAFVGRCAFSHKGGIHVSAVERNPLTYEHIDPLQVGNERRIAISEQSGLSNVLIKASEMGLTLTKADPRTRQILAKLKELEYQGYQFEGAEASFELLMREILGQTSTLFTIQGFQVHCSIATQQHHSLATIKIAVDGQDILEVAEGNGPVSALDAALRKALSRFYPELAKCHLTDYKVRIIDGGAGTAAITRVLVESSNGIHRWTTIGVSENILEASYQAVAQGIEYGLLVRSPQMCSLVEGMNIGYDRKK